MFTRAALSSAIGAAAAVLAFWLGRSIGLPAAGVSAEVFLIESVNAILLASGSLIATWYFLTAMALLVGEVLIILGAAPTAMLRALRRFGAPFLRHVAAVAAISAAASSPAWALPVDEPVPETQVSANEPTSPTDRNATFLIDLGWSEKPSTPPPHGPARSPQVTATSDPTDPPSREQGSTVTVEKGDTLWGIAQAHLNELDPAHTPSDIAREWPRWHSHNATTIGPDPHLLHPGMTLQAPPLEES